ncbi:PepSY domain-containing protein [Dyadobacter sp. BHUBP1]|uniref:PepSY-associated TM helix domain-containing protein n=1 Tax=Dyadobacter sp. BHUBP1 TaxID=3424178 RepID=UPI003D335E66
MIEDIAIQPKESFKAKAEKTIRRNIYRWHRILGLLALVPTIFWTASGVMHPFMSHWFKTTIAHEFYKAEPVAPADVTLQLGQVLTQNKIAEFKNFRLIKFDGNAWYQVKGVDNKLRYFSTTNGSELPDGDQKYAEHMARSMLGEPKSKIISSTLLTEFTDQYKYVNRFLPVWKISFDDSRKMDIYVETGQSRFATFNDSGRKAFIWIFSTFHNWGFMDMITNNTIRITVMVTFLSLIILSAVAGVLVYGLMWKKFKTGRSGNQRGILRKYHRSIGIWCSIFTFTFAFSGAYHAIQKLDPDQRQKYVYDPVIKTEEIAQASMIDLKGVTNIGLIKWGENIFWQTVRKDWETDKTVVDYTNIHDGKKLEDGNIRFAKYLARKFAAQEERNAESCCDLMEAQISSPISDAEVDKASLVTSFAGEYGFVNKRLPVVKLTYDTPDHTTYYIETTTSRLSTKVEDRDRREGFSFAFLHKYSGLDFLGKNARDGVMTAAAASVLVVSVLGLLVFLKIK